MTESTDDEIGTLIRPHRTQVAVSQDKQSVVLMFDSQDQKRVSILLPLMGSLALRDQLCGIHGNSPPESADRTRKEGLN